MYCLCYTQQAARLEQAARQRELAAAEEEAARDRAAAEAGRGGEEEEEEGEEMSVEDLSALDIQRVFRGHVRRKRLRFEQVRSRVCERMRTYANVC